MERKIEEQELTEAVNAWLASLPKGDRVLFVRRYWYGEAVNELAKKAGSSPANTAKRLYRLRAGLKAKLKKEGWSL